MFALKTMLATKKNIWNHFNNVVLLGARNFGQQFICHLPNVV
jgi:hypothetical protein